MCQLKNGCPGEFWALYSIHTTIYKFLDFVILGHTNAIKYIILEIISWKQYVSGIFLSLRDMDTL